jgi:hypothetical protein
VLDDDHVIDARDVHHGMGSALGRRLLRSASWGRTGPSSVLAASSGTGVLVEVVMAARLLASRGRSSRTRARAG